MGYRCPVCEDPQADGPHLANHLAFTALVRGGTHEKWLDEQVPDWGEMGEAELAAQVTTDIEETEFPQLFESEMQSHERDTSIPNHTSVQPAPELDDEAKRAIERARKLTSERRNDDADEGGEQQ